MKYTATMLLQRAVLAADTKPTEIVMTPELYEAIREESWRAGYLDTRKGVDGMFLGIPVRIDGVYIPRGV